MGDLVQLFPPAPGVDPETADQVAAALALLAAKVALEPPPPEDWPAPPPWLMPVDPRRREAFRLGLIFAAMPESYGLAERQSYCRGLDARPDGNAGVLWLRRRRFVWPLTFLGLCVGTSVVVNLTLIAVQFAALLGAF